MVECEEKSKILYDKIEPGDYAICELFFILVPEIRTFFPLVCYEFWKTHYVLVLVYPKIEQA